MVCDMLLKDVKDFFWGKLFIYKNGDVRSSTFETLYIGGFDNIPDDVLLMTIRTIGAKRKGVLDIWVE